MESAQYLKRGFSATFMKLKLATPYRVLRGGLNIAEASVGRLRNTFKQETNSINS
ncbi:hypothetical protein NBRC116495_35070 [Aurantivibrio plasticivorans]